MQTFRIFLLLLGSMLTAAQTPTFGSQYTGDVGEKLLANATHHSQAAEP